MGAAPLAMFLTEFSRGPRAAPQERAPSRSLLSDERAPSRSLLSDEPAPFDPESEIGAEFDAPEAETIEAEAAGFAAIEDDGDFATDQDESEPEPELADMPAFDVEDGSEALNEADETAVPSEAAPDLEDPLAEVEAQHQADTMALSAAHEAALAAARAEWAATEGERLASAFDAAFAELRDTIDRKLSDVLRPLLAGAIVTRVKTDLLEVIDKLIGDTAQPALRVRAPEDLLAVLKSARPDAPIEWVRGQSVEVTVTADGSTVETKLAAALADIAATEI